MKFVMWVAVTTIMGPNDARHVVWAIGEQFFIIIYSFIAYIVVKYKIHGMDCCDSKNGPR